MQHHSILTCYEEQHIINKNIYLFGQLHPLSLSVYNEDKPSQTLNTSRELIYYEKQGDVKLH